MLIYIITNLIKLLFYEENHVKKSGPGMVTVQSTINMNDRSFVVDSGGKLIVCPTASMALSP